MNVELFPCSGGMAEGFRRAGVRFDVAFDKDPDACDSYEKNHGHRPIQIDVNDLGRMVRAGWRPTGKRVFHVNGRDIPDPVDGGIDLLVADPPCTPWSRAGKRAGTDDPRDCLRITAELIRVLRPRAYLIGNVPGLQDSTSWHVVQDVIGGLAAHGYCVVDYASLDAADYGWVDLCQEHAHFAGLLSAPTTVQGTAESIRRNPHLYSHTNPVGPAGSGSAKTTGLASAEGATPGRSETRGGQLPLARPTDSGKADVTSTTADTPRCGSEESTNASTGSSLKRRSAGTLAPKRSSTIGTKSKTTTTPAISSPTPPTPITCASTSRAGKGMAAEVAGCSHCRWFATPQHRIRPFWFGHLDGPCIQWPAPTHGAPSEQLAIGAHGLTPWVTCRRALGHLELEELGRPVRMRVRPTGEDGRKNGGDVSRCSAPDKPAATVVSKDTRKGGAILLGNSKHPAATADGLAPTIRGGGVGHNAPQVLLTNSKHPTNTLDRPSMAVTTKGDGRGAQGACALRIPDPNRPPASADDVHRSVTTQAATTAVLEWPWDRPATTIQGDERLSAAGHHDPSVSNSQHGPNAIILSERAAAILQGFPDGWVFAGATKRARWSQLGQAMPPPLAEAVARSVVSQMRAAHREAA